MKIIDERKVKVPFNKIDSGNCFFANSELMMKTFCANSNDNAVSLRDGMCFHFNPNEEVLPVNAEIYICG